jgi:hypothetical protein
MLFYSRMRTVDAAEKASRLHHDTATVLGLMSALGQKRTFAPQKVMSALPPKATLDS